MKHWLSAISTYRPTNQHKKSEILDIFIAKGIFSNLIFVFSNFDLSSNQTPITVTVTSTPDWCLDLVLESNNNCNVSLKARSRRSRKPTLIYLFNLLSLTEKVEKHLKKILSVEKNRSKEYYLASLNLLRLGWKSEESRSMTVNPNI